MMTEIFDVDQFKRQVEDARAGKPAPQLPGMLKAFARHSFLHGLNEQLLMSLAAGVSSFDYEKGRQIATVGRHADAFYLIQVGAVEIRVSNVGSSSEVIQKLGPGDVVGWSWMLHPHEWQFDALVVERTTGLRFSGDWLRDLCERNHDIGYCLAKQLLRVVNGRLKNLCRTVNERIVRSKS
jgi:CRP-like cAMP-binding protein